MLDWQALQQYHLSAPTTQILRDPIVQQAYDTHIAKLRKFNINISEYIITSYDLTHDVVIAKNKFPYYLTPDIIHMIIWIKPGTRVEIAEMMQLLTGTGIDFVLFENTENNKSITEIQHFHLFSRETAFIGKYNLLVDINKSCKK